MDYPSIYDPDEEQLLQQAARIKALRAQAGEDVVTPGMDSGWTSAVTGAKMLGKQPKTSLLAAAVPLVAQYTANQQEGAMNEQRKALSERQVADYADWFKGKPKDEVVPLGPDEMKGSFVGDPMMSIAQMTDPVERANAFKAWQNQQAGNVKTVKPSEESMLNWMQKGSSLPMARQLAGDALKDYILTQPDKREQRTYESGEKALDRGATLTAAVAKARQDALEHAATRETTLEAARIRANATAAGKVPTQPNWKVSTLPNADGNNFMYNEKDPTQQMEIGSKPEKPPKALTKGESDAQNDLLTDHRTYSSAFSSYKSDYAGRGGTGKMDVLAGQYLPFYSDETKRYWEPVKKRLAVENHNIYGANYTAPEQQRAGAYQPSENNSDESNLKYLGQQAIDSGLAHLRSNYLHNNPGAYVDNDGSVVLKNGTIITDTKSRMLTEGEVEAKRIKPIPTYREVAAANPTSTPRAGRPLAPPAAAPAAPAPAAAPGVAKMPTVGEVRNGFVFLGGDPNDKTRWESMK